MFRFSRYIERSTAFELNMPLEIEGSLLSAIGSIAQRVYCTVSQLHGNSFAALHVDGSTSVGIGQCHTSQLQRQFIVAVDGQ